MALPEYRILGNRFDIVAWCTNFLWLKIQYSDKLTNYILLVFKDMDECATGSGGCDQICTNTPGSYQCSCNLGYFRSEHSCQGRPVLARSFCYSDALRSCRQLVLSRRKVDVIFRKIKFYEQSNWYSWKLLKGLIACCKFIISPLTQHEQ